MADGPQYLRHTRLTIVKPKPDPSTGVGSFFGLEHANALQIDELQVKFEIKKSIGSSTSNTCTMSATNLAEATRDEISAAAPLVAILEVAYGSDELRRIFIGDVFHVGHEFDGPTCTTKLQLHDGGRAYAYARVVQSFKAGSTVLQAVKAAAKALQLTVPPAVDSIPGMQRAVTAGISLAGSAAAEMSSLLAPLGLGWSIQDGALAILADHGIRPGEAILINEAAGMLGSPTWGNPSKAGKKPPLTVKMLLFPELTAGGLVQVRSRTANGDFKVTDVTHSGDSMGGDQTTTIECKAVG
jgi:hypothetical protein